MTEIAATTTPELQKWRAALLDHDCGDGDCLPYITEAERIEDELRRRGLTEVEFDP